MIEVTQKTGGPGVTKAETEGKGGFCSAVLCCLVLKTAGRNGRMLGPGMETGWIPSGGLLRCLGLQTSNMTGDSWKTKEFRAEAWISVKNNSCLHLRPLEAVCRFLRGWSSSRERGLSGSV